MHSINNHIDEFSVIRNWTYSVVRRKGLLMPADELINSAYISMHDKGVSFSLDNIKPFIYNEIRTYYSYSYTSYNECLPILANNLSIGDEKICKDCKQQLPVSMFYINRKYGTGIVTYQSCCKPCSYKRHVVSLTKRRQNPEYNLLYLNSLKEKQKKKWQIIKNNSRLKEHFSKLAAVRSTQWAKENPERVKEHQKNYKTKKYIS